MIFYDSESGYIILDGSHTDLFLRLKDEHIELFKMSKFIWFRNMSFAQIFLVLCKSASIIEAEVAKHGKKRMKKALSKDVFAFDTDIKDQIYKSASIQCLLQSLGFRRTIATAPSEDRPVGETRDITVIDSAVTYLHCGFKFYTRVKDSGDGDGTITAFLARFASAERPPNAVDIVGHTEWEYVRDRLASAIAVRNEKSEISESDPKFILRYDKARIRLSGVCSETLVLIAAAILDTGVHIDALSIQSGEPINDLVPLAKIMSRLDYLTYGSMDTRSLSESAIAKFGCALSDISASHDLTVAFLYNKTVDVRVLYMFLDSTCISTIRIEVEAGCDFKLSRAVFKHSRAHRQTVQVVTRAPLDSKITEKYPEITFSVSEAKDLPTPKKQKEMPKVEPLIATEEVEVAS
jgi:hypothetical protein